MKIVVDTHAQNLTRVLHHFCSNS